MRACDACHTFVEGDWQRCPLCSAPLHGRPVPSPFPTVPLEFSRRRVLKILFLTSLAVIALSLAAQLFFNRAGTNIGALRFVWLGIISMWLVVLMAIRKRRNIAKGTVYLVVIVGLLCVYWDYLTGWHGWSLTYEIPIMCASAIVALLITVRVMHLEVGEHIVYSSLTVLLGLLPIVFLVFGWVSTPWPSIICVALSFFALVILARVGGPDVRRELAKRLHL